MRSSDPPVATMKVRSPTTTEGVKAATSRAAARDVTASGERDRQARLVLDAVRAAPGSTSAELAGDAFDRYVASRRLPELERLGLVKRGESRPCRRTGKVALTWWSVYGAQMPKQVALPFVRRDVRT